MSLKEYLAIKEIDQIEDDEKFCREEYEAIRDYCTIHPLTEYDVREIELRGYQRDQFDEKGGTQDEIL